MIFGISRTLKTDSLGVSGTNTNILGCVCMGAILQNLTKPIDTWALKALPQHLQTERDLLAAEAEVFSGNLDWSKLHNLKPPKFSDEKQAVVSRLVEVDDYTAGEFAALFPAQNETVVRAAE